MSEPLVTNLKNRYAGIEAAVLQEASVSVTRVEKIGVQLILASLLFCLPGVVFASELIDMLEKMSAVSQTRNYQGTFILRKSDNLSTLRVHHGMDERGVWESLETLDGESRKVIRQNNKVISIFPGKKLLTIRSAGSYSSLHQKLPDNISQLENYYTFERLDNDRIAGYPTLVLELKPRDKYRYGYRYWLEHESGMLLRCDVIGSDNDVVEQMLFTDLQYLNEVPEMAFSDIGFQGYTVKNLDQTSRKVNASEWAVTQPPAGFALVQSHRRGLTAELKLLQLVYSDGLSSVSIFIEDMNHNTKHLSGASSMDAVHAYGIQVDDYYVTVVGEVPAATVKQMATSTRRLASASGK